MSLKDSYILMIISCKKYLKERREGQIAQFLKNPQIMQGIRYFHLEGDQSKFVNNPESKYIIDEKNNIIYTNTEDGYISLPHKIICGLTAIYENYKFNYILKTDDDQRLMINNIFGILDKKIKMENPDYLGKIMKVETHNYPDAKWLINNYKVLFPKTYYVGDDLPMSNGRFYGLSHRNVKDLVENKYDEIKKELVEDWAIAKYQKKEYRANKMYIETERIFKDIHDYNFRKVSPFPSAMKNHELLVQKHQAVAQKREKPRKRRSGFI
tara:strand:- start:1119 stop:1922 length:804 start_codon:yes stop_codon:yes gene_type:complete